MTANDAGPNVGQTVRLRSGGPDMTVSGNPSNTDGVMSVTCMWFADGSLRWHKFPLDVLTDAERRRVGFDDRGL